MSIPQLAPAPGAPAERRGDALPAFRAGTDSRTAVVEDVHDHADHVGEKGEHGPEERARYPVDQGMEQGPDRGGDEEPQEEERDEVILSGGLSAGERVVTSPLPQVIDDMEVEIQDQSSIDEAEQPDVDPDAAENND